MIKILTILGARPQFIKAATVSRAMHARDDVEEIITHTGQHVDANMSDVFFEQLDIPKPHHNLGIANLGHGAMTGRILEHIEALIQREQPDWVLVSGDTDSTLAEADEKVIKKAKQNALGVAAGSVLLFEDGYAASFIFKAITA